MTSQELELHADAASVDCAADTVIMMSCMHMERCSSHTVITVQPKRQPGITKGECMSVCST